MIKRIIIDKKYLKISCYTLAVIILAILSLRVSDNLTAIKENIEAVFGEAAKILATFVYGFFISLFLKGPVRWFERAVCGRIPYIKGKQRMCRVLSIAAVYALIIGVFFWVMGYLMPELVSSFRGIIDAARAAMDSLYRLGFTNLSENEFVNSIIDTLNGMFYANITLREIMEGVLAPIMIMLNDIPSYMGQIYTNIVSAMTNTLNFVLGIILSIYMLYEKENILAVVTKILYAGLKKRRADSLTEIGKKTNAVLESYVVGKVLDSVIMTVLFFFVCLALRLPYATLLCAVFGITNMIPYFGAIVGGVSVSLIVIMYDPMKGLWTAAAALVLQQIDGNIIGPKILGDSTGLKPLSVIFSILVGGALFGVVGMFFGTPVMSVITGMVGGYIDKRYAKKYGTIHGGPPPLDADTDVLLEGVAFGVLEDCYEDT